jgi:hypothetical protein
MSDQDMSPYALEMLKNAVEKMGKTQHIEIANLLKRNPAVKLNENKSGIYVNLSFLPKDTIHEMVEYVNYIKDQELALSGLETQKSEFKTAFFSDIP